MPADVNETLIDKGKESLKNAPNSIAVRAPKGRISDAALRALKPAGKPYKQSVGESLYLEVMPGGSKLWRWKYRIEGKENRYSLGSYPELSLKEAREAVGAARKLVNQGLHPAQQKKLDRIKATHAQAGTLEAIAKEWLALKDWEEITKKRRENMLKRVVFPTLGELPIRQITSPMILDVLKKAEANNGLSVRDEAKRTLFGIFEFALEMERVEVNPVRQWKTALPKNKTQHKRPLDKTEIGKLMRDTDNPGGSLQTQCAFKLMWLTLARPSEVVEAEWAEFDLEKAIWRIPAERMKMRKEHVIPLPTQAIEVLHRMSVISGDRKHVFPHRDNRAKPMVAASFRQMLNVLGWGGKYSPHATRTTGSTRLNEMGFSADWIERQLAHTEPNAVRRTYNHADHFRDRAKMMQHWADLLDEWKRGDSNVVSIKREAAA
ncbi:Prophage integrase IntA [Ferriphaselus amnicola]|uniref:Prophage integrase IntA n=1 Tax=Ferriphaselus amnicola TaxID=1188319 RepID=A0A2Z6G8D0_9PROT|nr:tyrosine-type recombinase/integrase [Ferriphaselus amnicola]BBE49669.1 Prophage integrase IntA [Ferriphaselus amnicola]